MSKKHPIIAVTGSSGAGTTTVKQAFEHIFLREGVNPVVIEGDSYHKYDRAAMKVAMQEAETAGNHSFSHFGPEANLFDKLEETFKSYGDTGSCQRRYYLHSEEEAEPFGHPHEGRYGVRLHLLHHLAAVYTDRLFCRTEVAGDLLVGAPGCQVREYFEFPAGQGG